MDLIKTVRGLDQNGPGGNGENLETLWKHLTASADGQFHAAEESTLRWLLKSMNGTSKDAETLRRWPLTWTILECVFQRIPLFSLAKSLADRRFIAVLQQTLKNISQSASDTKSASSSKRKRSPTNSFDVDELRSEDGCLSTGGTLFHALKRLLGRLEATGAHSSHDKLGAGHIRSLFCTTAAEAAPLCSLALMVCDLGLISDDLEQSESREEWIDTISSIWDLHLQGAEDVSEVATHLFGPASSMIGKIEGLPQKHDSTIPEKLRNRWSSDIQKFMHRNLLFPSRAVYLSRQDSGTIEKALEVTNAKIDVSAPVLYFLASGATAQLTDGRLRKGNGEWMKQVFKSIDNSLKSRKDRGTLLQTILERAAKLDMSIDTNDLRSICREDALSSAETNWSLVADIATCDPDVFQLTGEGESLLKDVCERSTESKLKEPEAHAVSRILAAIVKSYRTGRDFSGFLKLWFEQLGKMEKQKSASASPWLKVAAQEYGNDSFVSLIEKELSPQQLVEILEWVETEKPHARALCLFVNAAAQGVQHEAYVDAVGTKMFDLVSQVSKPSTKVAALKWGVVSKTLSWATPDERSKVWVAVAKQLSNVLKESPITSKETFEAFKCCTQAWVAMSPDDETVGEPAALVEAFSSRLATDLVSSRAMKTISLSSHLLARTDDEFSEDNALEYYLAWFLRGSARLNHLFSQRKAGSLPEALQNALDAPKCEIGESKAIWGSLLSNDNNLNDVKVIEGLIGRLVKSVEDNGKEKRWPAESSQATIQNLSCIPVDAFTRPQREQIMALLIKHRAATTKRISVEGWKLVLGLSTKLMSRATFYKDMKFEDIVDIADAMADLSSSTSTEDGTLGDLIEAFFIMASTTIRQMAEHIEERSLTFFGQGRSFIAESNDTGDLSPFRITLLKALVVETSNSPHFQHSPDQIVLREDAKDTLATCIMSATGYFLTEKKAFEGHNVVADLRLLAATHAADAAENLAEAAKSETKLKKSDFRKAEKRSQEAINDGDLRGWKVQTFLRTHFSSVLENARPTTFSSLETIPLKLREPLLRSNVLAVTKNLNTSVKIDYLKELVESFVQGSDTDGQALAINNVVNQLVGKFVSSSLPQGPC